MRLAALCLLTLVTPSTAGAQLPILERLFKKVSTWSVSMGVQLEIGAAAGEK